MHGCDLCNEANHDRNSYVSAIKVSFTERVVLMALHEERFSYEGGCGHTHIEAIKEVLAWAMNKQIFQFSNNVMLLKTIVLLSYQRIKPF